MLRVIRGDKCFDFFYNILSMEINIIATEYYSYNIDINNFQFFYKLRSLNTNV
jgi:hypothetical protein